MNLLRHATRTFAARTQSLACVAVFASLLLVGCQGGGASGDSRNEGNAAATNASDVNAPAVRPAFDGARAFEHVRKMVEIGPRPAGSQELAKTREYIVGELQSGGLKVTQDEWDAQTPVGTRHMVNLIAEVPGKSQDVIIVSSHYDTKTFKQFRFVGANDGGSSTGTLMEIARSVAASKQQPALTYWFVFFDGEEAFCNGWDQCKTPDGQPDNTYGSRHMVEKLKSQGQLTRVRAMILLDMMGYKNLTLARDDMGTRWLEDIIWQTGKELGYGSTFVEGEEGVGGDDHEPFLKAGIDSCDLIQLNAYPYWHQPTDTLDKISQQSLQIVGETVIASLPRVERNVVRH